MNKHDLKRELGPLYQTSAKTPVRVEVPAFNFLMIDGMGDPNTAPEYTQAVEALFAVAYTAKFLLKKGPQAIDYAVMPLEGLWWADDMTAFSSGLRDQWRWTMMIMQPDFVSPELIETAIGEVRRKKNLPALPQLRLERFEEGACAQLLHIGPFSEEEATIEQLHHFIADGGWQSRGRHHEIYLSDIRRAAPEKWKTVIRQPIASPGAQAMG